MKRLDHTRRFFCQPCQASGVRRDPFRGGRDRIFYPDEALWYDRVHTK